MSCFFPVWCWFKFASPIRHAQVAQDPARFLARATRVISMSASLGWGLMVQTAFTLIYHNPSSFWYVLPLCASVGMSLFFAMGEGEASPEFQIAAREALWDNADIAALWPEKYRTRAWQVELAFELMGDQNRARLQAIALQSSSPSADPTPGLPPRRL